MYFCMPGVVTSFDATTQTANVQPTLNDVRVDVDTGTLVYEQWPVLPGVPVAYLRGGGFVLCSP